MNVGATAMSRLMTRAEIVEAQLLEASPKISISLIFARRKPVSLQINIQQTFIHRYSIV
jgi:hypothetical protein